MLRCLIQVMVLPEEQFLKFHQGDCHDCNTLIFKRAVGKAINTPTKNEITIANIDASNTPQPYPFVATGDVK